MPDAANGLVGVDGKVYKLPQQYVAIIAMYNPVLFADNGLTVPTTYSELLDFCDAANALGIAPIALGAQVPFMPQMLAYPMVASTVYVSEPDFNQKTSGANPGCVAFAWQKNAPGIVYPRRSLLGMWPIRG